MDRSGAPAKVWLLCLIWVCYVLNRTSTASLGGNDPMKQMTGNTTDTTNLFRFTFWEEILFHRPEQKFPSDSTEVIERIVRFSENVGNDMCYQMYNPATNKVIHTS